MTDVSCPYNGLTMTTLWEDRFALTLQIIFRGTRQIFHMYHTEVSWWRWEGVKWDWEINTTEGKETERGRGEVWPAWLTVDSVGCDFHSLLAVCVEAITSVTGRLINEPLSLSVQFEEGPWPYPRHHWFIRLWSKPPNITHILKYKSEHSHTWRQTHVRPPWYAYTIQVGAAQTRKYKDRHGRRLKLVPLLCHLLRANENLNVSALSRGSEDKTHHV